MDELAVSVHPQQVLRDRFAQRATTSAFSRSKAYAQWLWIASNTTLVVPVLIAAYFLYLAWHGLDRRTDALEKAQFELIRAQSELINALSVNRPSAAAMSQKLLNE